jgi:vancomycin resistance protein YoaR
MLAGIFVCALVLSDPSAEPVIGLYTTSIAGQEPGVVFNIRRAASRIDGYIIRPGEVFSFNTAVGEANTANGYRSAGVLYRDEVRTESGGGVCQLSSTVFNALLLSGFGIVERHRHMQPVRYAEPGRDATIRYGKKDLRMQNLTGADCRISVSMTESTLAVSIRSAASRAFDIEIIADESETEIPLEDHVRPGIEVDVFRLKYRNGKLIEKGLLYRDFYPPVRIQ